MSKSLIVVDKFPKLGNYVLDHFLSLEYFSLISRFSKNESDRFYKPINILEDSIELSNHMDSNTTIIYISEYYLQNIKSPKQSLSENITPLTNLLNASIENSAEKFIYIGNQEGYNFSSSEITMNENTVNNFTKEFSPESRISLLMELEVLRALNEGLNCSILSCGNILFNDKISNKELAISMVQKQNENNYFIFIDDLVKIISQIHKSKYEGKLLIHNIELTLQQLKYISGYKEDSNWFSTLFFNKNKLNKITMDNTLSKKVLNYTMKDPNFITTII